MARSCTTKLATVALSLDPQPGLVGDATRNFAKDVRRGRAFAVSDRAVPDRQTGTG